MKSIYLVLLLLALCTEVKSQNLLNLSEGQIKRYAKNQGGTFLNSNTRLNFSDKKLNAMLSPRLNKDMLSYIFRNSKTKTSGIHSISFFFSKNHSRILT